MQALHILILFLLLLSISRHNGKTMDEGIAYLRHNAIPHLIGNGPSFRNTLMLS
jgi:hypothetical protein